MPYDPSRHGSRRVVGEGFHERVYEVVSRIPAGAVASYGDVADALGLRSAARQVGYALAALPTRRRDVPWHRVVNAKGRLTSPGRERQARRLREEGVEIEDDRVVDFESVRIPADWLRA